MRLNFFIINWMTAKLLILFSFLAFLFSLSLSIFFKAVSIKSRSFNINGVSFLGGLAFSLASLSIFSFYIKTAHLYVPQGLIVIILFSFIILFLELLDDLREFNLRKKVLTQAVVFILFFLFGGKTIHIYIFPLWVNYLLTFLWLMGITNAFNHLDIADGLCGGISLLIALAFSIFAFLLKAQLVFYFSFFLSFSLLGFLLLNCYPAKIYMGNSGSHFLGFLFAALSMYLDYAGKYSPHLIIIPLLILGVPIVDTVFLLYIRPKKRILPLKKSNDHIFIRLRKMGLSYQTSALAFYLLTLICILSAFLLYLFPFLGLFAVAVLFTFTFFLLKRVSLASE